MTTYYYKKRYLHELSSRWMGSFREIIFGIEDGLVSTLGVVIGIAAATQDTRTVIISGLVVVFVEAISMGAGTYLSNKSEYELERQFLREEAEEIKLKPAEERAEVVQYLKKIGYTEREIPVMVDRITSDKSMWLRFMAVNELGFVPDKKNGLPFSDTLFMWVSYLVGGFIAMSAFYYLPINIAPSIALATVIVALFFLGAIKAKLVHTSWLKSGLEMMIVGLTAAGIGQLVGWLADTYLL